MKVIISPAKNMRVITREDVTLSNPLFIEQAKELMSILKTFQPFDLENLMNINSKLALETFLDLQNWSEEKQTTPALFAYHGLQYMNIDPDSLTTEELDYAGETVRILSGLYGILKASDQVCPYRLEMLCKLKIEDKNLYQY